MEEVIIKVPEGEYTAEQYQHYFYNIARIQNLCTGCGFKHGTTREIGHGYGERRLCSDCHLVFVMYISKAMHESGKPIPIHSSGFADTNSKKKGGAKKKRTKKRNKKRR